MLSQIIKLVEDAQGSKAPIQKLADVVSSYFVPTVISLAVLSFGYWYLVGGTDFCFCAQHFYRSAYYCLPMCACLATPTAIMVGTGKRKRMAFDKRRGGS